MASKNSGPDKRSSLQGGLSHGSLHHQHVHGESPSDAELIRLADAYTINMLDDPRPLPGDDAAIEESTRIFLEYMREAGYALAEHDHPFSPDDLEAWRARRKPSPETSANRGANGS
ncbi:MAG TPA: hypothetical protein VF006_16355 [Longimicrobium sp.]